MIWYAVATVFLCMAIAFLICCAVYRTKAHKAEDAKVHTSEKDVTIVEEKESKEAAKAYKKARIFLIVGVLCLIITEIAILCGNYMK